MVKTYRRRRLGGVRHHVVFGPLAGATQGLAAPGWHRNPAVIERVHLSLRPPVAAVGRRVMTRCTGEAGFHQPLALYHTDDHVGLPHAS